MDPTDADPSTPAEQSVSLNLFASSSAYGFFSSPEPESETPSPSRERVAWIQPAWFGPDENILGATIPITPIAIVQTDHVSLSLETVTAFPVGVKFKIAVRIRRLDWDDDAWDDVQEVVLDRGFPRRKGRGVDRQILVGVALADGTRAIATDGQHLWRSGGGDDPVPPTGPLLLERGGGGSSSNDVRASTSRGFWLWPLPQADITIVVAWPVLDVAEHSVVVPGHLLTDAASRAITAWQ